MVLLVETYTTQDWFLPFFFVVAAIIRVSCVRGWSGAEALPQGNGAKAEPRKTRPPPAAGTPLFVEKL